MGVSPTCEFATNPPRYMARFLMASAVFSTSETISERDAFFVILRWVRVLLEEARSEDAYLLLDSNISELLKLGGDCAIPNEGRPYVLFSADIGMRSDPWNIKVANPKIAISTMLMPTTFGKFFGTGGNKLFLTIR